MTLRLNGSSSGFTEIDAPAAAGSNTITLPTSNGSAEQFLKNSGTAGELEYSRMVETSTGVGIGTSSPSAIAHFKGAGGAASGNELLRLETEQSTGGGWISFNDASARKGYMGYKETGNDGIHIVNEENSFLALGTNGSERARLDSSGRLLVGSTSYSFAATAVLQGNSSNSAEDAVLRMHRGGTPGANADLGFISFGDNAGNVGASIRSANSTSSSWATNDYPGNLTFHTTADGASSPTERMKISYDGTFRVQGVYDNTLASSANVHVDSGGLIRRVTSSAKYKTNIETIEDSYADALLNCRPVWYQSTCEGDNPDHSWWGFIAEEVAEIDPRLVHWKTTNVTYDEDGRAVEAPCDAEAEGVLYDRFVPHFVNLIKRQKTRIETLETQNTAQQAQIDDLLARVTALEAA